MAWLHLVRWKNLLIILLTQLVAWWCLVVPYNSTGNNGFTLSTGTVNFLCLAFSTILIAAAGYIINDYFDIKIDLINRPGKVVLGKMIPRKTAIISHTVLNIAALVLAGYVAIRAHHPEWLLLQLSCTLLLWFYSTDFKRQYMSGNIVVALLTALTIIALIIYGPAIRTASPSQLQLWALIVFAYFAFMLTWMREIVKDMEDFKGDEAAHCHTMPIKKGLGYAKRFIIFLSVLVLLPLAAASFLLIVHHHLVLAGYLLLLLVLPIILWTLFLGRNYTAAHYHKASRGLKLIMVLGICSLIIYKL